MKLIEFSVTNYRSITTAHKIPLQNLTVLVGKNNEGKSNLLTALNVAMNAVIMHSRLRDGQVVLDSRYPYAFNWKYRNGEITKEQYDEWRYTYPKLDTTQTWAKVPSQELSNTMVEAFKDKLKNM